MNAGAFLRSLQIADSFFPVGSFAWSDGLETAAAEGQVADAAALAEWMDHFLEWIFIPCEGLALLKCMRALKHGDVDAVRSLDLELTALRPAAAVRTSSTSIGRRVLTLFAAVCGNEKFPDSVRLLPQGNAAAAYALVFHDSGVEETEAVLAFGYNRLTGMVSTALRLIPLGQQQGQMLLTKALTRLPEIATTIQSMADEPLRSFGPLCDIAQMNHQYLYSRLFRS